jgi:hypothetical protein
LKEFRFSPEGGGEFIVCRLSQVVADTTVSDIDYR